MKKRFLLLILSLTIGSAAFFSSSSASYAANCPVGDITDPGCTCVAPNIRVSYSGGGQGCLPRCNNGQNLNNAAGQIQCACPGAPNGGIVAGQCVLNNPPPVGPGAAGGGGSYDGITNPVTGSLGDNPTEAAAGTTFLTFLITLWRAIITLGGLMVLIFFLWGAIEWITAGGDSSKVQKARDRITQAIIGMVLLVASFVIIGFISQLFFGPDFNLLNLTIPTPA